MRSTLFSLATLFFSSSAGSQPVTTSDLENAASDNSSWLTYGRDYYAQLFVAESGGKEVGQVTITYELDSTQYLAVPSGSIGGDMSFYYKEPKAGNIWVFALDGGGGSRVPSGTNLVTLEGGLPRVGEPGHTLKGLTPPQPTSATEADAEVLARGERLYRARCVGCHQSGGASGPTLFRTTLPEPRVVEAVAKGVEGTLMPAFGSPLSDAEIREIYTFALSRDRLE